MMRDDLKSRTKKFGLEVIRLVEALPPKPATKVIGHQLLRCATSVGANYRAACRARSPAEFRARLAIVEEEADESGYWIEILIDAAIVKPEIVADLAREAGELTAIAVASINTSRRNEK
jgi:four helix bundle protein